MSSSTAGESATCGPQLIVVSGPTASGKSTLWRRLVQHPQVTFSVSATTRKLRPGEVDGKDYYYVSDERFDEMIAAAEGDSAPWYLHAHFLDPHAPYDPPEEYLDALRHVVQEAKTEPELVKSAPHRSVVHKNDESVMDDPAKWAVTWRAFVKKHGEGAAKIRD